MVCQVLTAQMCLWDMIKSSVLLVNIQHSCPQLFYSCALKEPEDQQYFSPFVTLPQVRRAIHVGNLTFHSGEDVEKHLLEDVMKSIKPWLGVLMDNYRVSGSVSRQPEQLSLPQAERKKTDLSFSKLGNMSTHPGVDVQRAAGRYCSSTADREVPAYRQLDRSG